MEMFDVNLQKQRRYWRRRTIRNENGIVEKIYSGLILFLGVISTVYPIVLVVYSVILVVHGQSLMELLKTLIVAALLLAMGLGSLWLFRKRQRDAARKKDPWKL